MGFFLAGEQYDDMGGGFFRALTASFTWPVAGVVLALILFDGIKDAVLLPLSHSLWERAGVRGARMRALLAHALLVLALGGLLCLGLLLRASSSQAKRASPASSALTAMWSWPLAGLVLALLLLEGVKGAVLWPAGRALGRRLGVSSEALLGVVSTLCAVLFLGLVAWLAWTVRRRGAGGPPPESPPDDIKVSESAEKAWRAAAEEDAVVATEAGVAAAMGIQYTYT